MAKAVSNPTVGVTSRASDDGSFAGSDTYLRGWLRLHQI